MTFLDRGGKFKDRAGNTSVSCWEVLEPVLDGCTRGNAIKNSTFMEVETGSHYVFQAGLKLQILLPHLPDH
jgi:hypothetical protein